MNSRVGAAVDTAVGALISERADRAVRRPGCTITSSRSPRSLVGPWIITGSRLWTAPEAPRSPTTSSARRGGCSGASTDDVTPGAARTAFMGVVVHDFDRARPRQLLHFGGRSVHLEKLHVSSSGWVQTGRAKPDHLSMRREECSILHSSNVNDNRPACGLRQGDCSRAIGRKPVDVQRVATRRWGLQKQQP
jgi:hypothetical protein